MEYDYDIYHPTHENDYDAAAPSTNAASNKNITRRMINELRKMDKHFHTIKNAEGNYINCYSSGIIGNRIRHAITGNKSKYEVGSRYEDLYFKVMIADGTGGQVPLTLFYDGPNEYEQHYNSHVPKEIKDAWIQKNIALKTRLVK